MTVQDENQARIQALESELLELRRRAAREAPPKKPFGALRISVGDTTFLLPVAQVREVVYAAWLSPIPGAPPWLLGTLNYGERAVPVVDLGRRLMSQATPVHVDNVLVVVHQPSWYALAATRVGEVVWVDPERLHAVPPETPLSSWIVTSYPDSERGIVHLLSTAVLLEDVSPYNAERERRDAIEVKR